MLKAVDVEMLMLPGVLKDDLRWVMQQAASHMHRNADDILKDDLVSAQHAPSCMHVSAEMYVLEVLQ